MESRVGEEELVLVAGGGARAFSEKPAGKGADVARIKVPVMRYLACTTFSSAISTVASRRRGNRRRYPSVLSYWYWRAER